MSFVNPVKIGLSKHVIEKFQSVFSKYPDIERVILYGSRALGTFRTGSDIDLCIEGKKVDLSLLFAIENQLDELMLPWKIDLTLKHSIDNADLVAHIKQHGQIFYP